MAQPQTPLFQKNDFDSNNNNGLLKQTPHTFDEQKSPSRRIRLNSFVIENRATNVTFQQHKVTRDERCSILGRHRGCTLWFTGLSGAGKTTISFAVEKTLIHLGIPCYGLDGDNVRHGLCKNLGFRKEDRTENIRRVAEVSKLFADMGVITLASFISPFKTDREAARAVHEKDGIKFFEIYVSTPLDICEARDPKQLYKKARSGQLLGFTGIDSVYETPENPDLELNAGTKSEAELLQAVLDFLSDNGFLPEKTMHQLYGPPVCELFVKSDEERQQIEEASANAPEVSLSLIDLQWVHVLSEGWASPLTGFMRERQYLQCLHNGQIFDFEKGFIHYQEARAATTPTMMQNAGKEGLKEPLRGLLEDDCQVVHSLSYKEECSLLDPINQSIPIVLPIDDVQKARLYTGEEVVGTLAPFIKLTFNGRLIAVLSEPEVFEHRKQERICRQFGCADTRHPTIKQINESGNWLLGGDLKVLERIRYNDGLDDFRKTPSELRQMFLEMDSDCVFAFQLRNPIHNGHALLMRETRERLLNSGYRNPILLLHPLGGWTKDDDVPLDIRMKQHQAVIDAGALGKEWTMLAIFPSPMLYAGPTEVQWHAKARLSCGVNAYIVGRDPAGIQNPANGDYLYEPTHGGKILSMAPGLSNLQIIPFRVAAYDTKQGAMAFFDPARKEDFQFISGTMMRQLARSGQSPPDGFMEPAAWKVLVDHYSSENLTTSKNNKKA